jgi:hypothetical protein
MRMIRKFVPAFLALILAGAGCCYTGSVTGGWDLYTNSARNLAESPVCFFDDVATTCRLRRYAEDAWLAARKASPDQRYSPDYAYGFKAGFVDYADAGGTGEPPAVPPFCYRLSCEAGPGRFHAVQDWYAGFRHGAAVARESGLRESLLVPLSAIPIARTTPPPAYSQATTEQGAPDLPAPNEAEPRQPGASDLLPTPREVPPPP